MKNTLIIDSSVFLSSLFVEEPGNKISIKLMNYIAKNRIRIIVPMIVYCEVLHNYYRFTRNIKETDAINENFIRMNLLGCLKIINMESAVLAEFISEHHNFDLKTSDTIIALCAMQSKSPLITLDNKLLKIPAHKVQSYTPKEFLNKYA